MNKPAWMLEMEQRDPLYARYDDELPNKAYWGEGTLGAGKNKSKHAPPNVLSTVFVILAIEVALVVCACVLWVMR